MPENNPDTRIMTTQQALDLAIRHHQAGRLSEAEVIYRQILAQQPDNSDALNLLGMIAHQAGKDSLAAELINRAIALNPSEAIYHNNLGLALMNLGRVQAAADAYQNAVRLKSNYPEAYNNLGNALKDLERYPEALDAFHTAIQLNPGFAEPYYNLGCTLKAQGRLDEAIAAFGSAIQIRPDLAVAYNNLGAALREQGKPDEALTLYRRALEISPRMVELHVNLGNALKDLHQYEAAENAYRQAIRLKADLIEAHNNLGNIYKDQGRIDEALAAFHRALKLQPNSNQVHSNLIYTLHYHHDSSARSIYDELVNWNRLHAEPLNKIIPPLANPDSHRDDPGRRLKIGYVSPDFRAHVVGWNLLPLLQEHNHEHFEIFCYSAVAHPDPMTAQLRSCADSWRNIMGLSDQHVAHMILEDKIDILVDLALHSADNRLLLFARKPAPVQVTYLGYPGSTGMDAVDYRFSDPYLDPPETDLSVYSEQTVRLPQTYWCYQPAGLAPVPAPLPALSAGFITFGCLNNYAKVSSAALDLWARILKAIPGSRIIIHSDPGKHLDLMLKNLADAGVLLNRLDFFGTQPWQQYMQTYNRIDIGLDPFPYGGGITTCDSLYMGAPVVSLSGQTAVGRGGRSILTNIGLPELVAYTPQEYVDIAVKLSGDLPRLKELRSTLRQRMQNSPLMDAKSFARNVEAAYREMWKKWCTGAAEPHRESSW